MSDSPYWLFRKMYTYRFLLSVAFIVIIALLIRFYQLGSIPAGLTWDEAAIGYNGHSIVTTRRDEWLERLPISFRSFGDYKAPLAIYLNGPFTYLLGLNPFAVRLPFALSGVIAIIGIMLLTTELWKFHPQRKVIALMSGAVLTFSPWHIQFTRAGFESGLALTLVLWATYFFVTAFGKGQRTTFWLSISALMFVLSMYAYHSTKLFTPLFVLILAIFYRRELFKNLKETLISGVIGIVAITPLVRDALYGSGLERADVTVFSQAESGVQAIQMILNNFVHHLQPSFLIFGEVDSLRHGTGSWGVLLYTTAGMVLLGIGWYLWVLLKRNFTHKKIFFLASFYILWIIIGLLPAAIGKRIPHSNRGLMALPGFIGLALVGAVMFRHWLGNLELNRKWQDSQGNGNLLIKATVGILATIHIFLFTSYFATYLTQYPAQATEAYNEGYLTALELAKKYEVGEENYPRVNQIIVSSQLGQPVIYTLFVKEISPIRYHQGGLINYLFVDEVNVGDLQRENTLVVATSEDELDLRRADHKIYTSNGEIRFGLFVTE